MKKLLIFDLDGTLLNTIADLAASTNYALEKNGFPTHKIEEYNYFVGNGINKLFERALPEGEKTEENILKVRKEFVPYYDIHNADFSCPYPGIVSLLSDLQDKGFKLAVASNKYHEATLKLVAHFFPGIKFSVVLGQRENVPAKPSPDIVYEILSETGIDKSDTLYIGDSNVDMHTAAAAGVDACGVVWGFRPVEELKEHAPRFIAEKAEDILAYAYR